MNKGFFTVSNDTYLNNWECIAPIFEHFRPSHIECKHWENYVWYFYGESSKFEPTIEGQRIPRYDIMVTRHEDNKYTHEVVKA